MDFETRRKCYSLCMDESLAPTDPRNLDIDGQDGHPRGICWAERLATQVLIAPEPVQLFFTGLVGSGKSTELKRFASILEKNRQLVVFVDALEMLNLADRIDIPDIHAVLLYATEKTILSKEGVDPEQALQSSYLSRLWTWLTNTDAELKTVEFGIANIAKFAFEMKDRPILRQRVRETIARQLPYFLNDVREEYKRLNKRAHDLGYMGLCIIFDSLEKLRGTATNYEDVLASAENIFGQGAPHLKIPAHVVYTVPPSLVSRVPLEFKFMPMVMILNRDGSPKEEGIRAIRELIRLRLSDELLEEILGKEFETRIREITLTSGGIVRQVLRMLRWMLELPAFPIRPEDIERAFREIEDQYSTLVTREDYPWLRCVSQDKSRTADNKDQRAMVERALQNDVVLRYCNGGEWWDVHPVVKRILDSHTAQL